MSCLQSLRTLIQSRSLTIEVSPEGHSAILRGAVPSEHDRQTTELLVMLEPGIQKVENELTVDSTLPPVPASSAGPEVELDEALFCSPGICRPGLIHRHRRKQGIDVHGGEICQRLIS